MPQAAGSWSRTPRYNKLDGHRLNPECIPALVRHLGKDIVLPDLVYDVMTFVIKPNIGFAMKDDDTLSSAFLKLLLITMDALSMFNVKHKRVEECIVGKVDSAPLFVEQQNAYNAAKYVSTLTEVHASYLNESAQSCESEGHGVIKEDARLYLENIDTKNREVVGRRITIFVEEPFPLAATIDLWLRRQRMANAKAALCTQHGLPESVAIQGKIQFVDTCTTVDDLKDIHNTIRGQIGNLNPETLGDIYDDFNPDSLNPCFCTDPRIVIPMTEKILGAKHLQSKHVSTNSLSKQQLQPELYGSACKSEGTDIPLYGLWQRRGDPTNDYDSFASYAGQRDLPPENDSLDLEDAGSPRDQAKAAKNAKSGVQVAEKLLNSEFLLTANTGREANQLRRALCVVAPSGFQKKANFRLFLLPK